MGALYIGLLREPRFDQLSVCDAQLCQHIMQSRGRLESFPILWRPLFSRDETLLQKKACLYITYNTLNLSCVVLLCASKHIHSTYKKIVGCRSQVRLNP